MLHFCNDGREFSYDLFKKNLNLILKERMQLLSRLEEEITSLDYKVGYFNLTKVERDAVYLLKNDNTIIIKDADKGSVVFIWDREDYLKEAKKQLDYKNIYKELTGDVEGLLEKIIKIFLEKIRDRRNISNSTLDYFLANNPKF